MSNNGIVFSLPFLCHCCEEVHLSEIASLSLHFSTIHKPPSVSFVKKKKKKRWKWERERELLLSVCTRTPESSEKLFGEIEVVDIHVLYRKKERVMVRATCHTTQPFSLYRFTFMQESESKHIHTNVERENEEYSNPLFFYSSPVSLLLLLLLLLLAYYPE